jgi:hypothetical protein
MLEREWSLLALIGVAGAWLATTSSLPARRAVVGHDLGPETESLEARVSAHPDDAAALVDLTDHYLDHGAPGLAQAALDRAPTSVRELPSVVDVRARALWDLGLVPAALELQRAVLTACATQTCSRNLIGRAQRRERWLTELSRLGVDDPKDDPNRAVVAYWRSTREVRLDIR